MAKAGPNVESGWDLLFAVSLVGIVAAGYYAFAMNSPRAAAPKTAQKSLNEAQQGQKSAAAKADETDGYVKHHTWGASAETLNARMMDKINGIAEEHHVQVANFQAGKPIDAITLMQAPFVVTLQGTFKDVLQTIHAIEEPDTRIAVSGIKLEPAKMIGSAANSVSSTLNLTAFLAKEKA